jgi:hypothetical protein
MAGRIINRASGKPNQASLAGLRPADRLGKKSLVERSIDRLSTTHGSIRAVDLRIKISNACSGSGSVGMS